MAFRIVGLIYLFRLFLTWLKKGKMMDIFTESEKRISQDEGYRQHLYILDGVQHIGYGFNLDDCGLYRNECEFILANRIRLSDIDLVKNFTGYASLSDSRKIVLLELCYMMGISRLMGFRDFISCTAKQDWVGASKALIDSKAYIQNTKRIEKLAYAYEMDKL